MACQKLHGARPDEGYCKLTFQGVQALIYNASWCEARRRVLQVLRNAIPEENPVASWCEARRRVLQEGAIVSATVVVPGASWCEARRRVLQAVLCLSNQVGEELHGARPDEGYCKTTIFADFYSKYQASWCEARRRVLQDSCALLDMAV